MGHEPVNIFPGGMNWWKTFLEYSELMTFLGHDYEPVDIPLGELICDDLRTFPGGMDGPLKRLRRLGCIS